MTIIKYADVFEAIPADAPPLAIPVGATPAGTLQFIDLAKAPHVLFAGTTGSGKSVGLNVAISTIAQRSDAEFVMIDPKRVELIAYTDMAQVRSVTTDMDIASMQIEALVEEMDARYSEFSENRVRKLADYNAKTGENLNEIVLVVDELSDLMDTHAKVVLPGLVRLAQLGRAAGIHMMLATQRPAADTIPKKLLGNVPTRIAYRTQSHTESRLIIGESGAEDLKGNGDLLAMIPSVTGLVRAQGPYISDEEIEAVAAAFYDSSDDDIIAEELEEDPEGDEAEMLEAMTADEPTPNVDAERLIADMLAERISARDTEVKEAAQRAEKAEAEAAALKALVGDLEVRLETADERIAELEGENLQARMDNDRMHDAKCATERDLAESMLREKALEERAAKIEALGMDAVVKVGWALTIALFMVIVVGVASAWTATAGAFATAGIIVAGLIAVAIPAMKASESIIDRTRNLIKEKA